MGVGRGDVRHGIGRLRIGGIGVVALQQNPVAAATRHDAVFCTAWYS